MTQVYHNSNFLWNFDNSSGSSDYDYKKIVCICDSRNFSNYSYSLQFQNRKNCNRTPSIRIKINVVLCGLIQFDSQKFHVSGNFNSKNCDSGDSSDFDAKNHYGSMQFWRDSDSSLELHRTQFWRFQRFYSKNCPCLAYNWLLWHKLSHSIRTWKS